MGLDESSPDVPFLWDMREAGLGIIRLTRTVRYEQFCADFELIETTERALTIIGRAARLVSSETRDACPEIAWRQLIEMARLLGDVDDALDADELWQTLRDMPAMVRRVSLLMPADDDVSG